MCQQNNELQNTGPGNIDIQGVNRLYMVQKWEELFSVITFL